MDDTPVVASPDHGRRARVAWPVGIFVLGLVLGAAGMWTVVNIDTPNDASFAAGEEAPPSGEATTIRYDPDLVTIEYEIVTDGMSVTHLSWVDVVDGAPTMMEKLGTPPPFEHVIQLPKDEPFDLTELSVTGMGAATSTTTTCTLRIDGRAVARQTADGTYGVVSCQASE